MTCSDRQMRALIVRLSARDERRRTAKMLAEHLGAAELYAFVADQDLDGTLVPAPGFAPTLPGGRGWDDLLERAASAGFHKGEVLPTADADAPAPALAYTYEEMTLVVAGADLAPSGLEPLVELAPLLESLLRSEHDEFVSRGSLRVAQQAARQSAALASALERTRDAREQAMAELEAQARKLEQARRQAEDALRVKDEFLAMLGHELRNPLAPIATSVDVLRLKSIDMPEIDVIDRQVTHLTRLVDDLLDVSRITRGKVDLRREHVAMTEIIHRAIEMASPLLEQKRQRLLIDTGPSDLTVDADPARLAQVLSNLLTNAAKFSPPEASIELCCEREGDQAKVTVKDDGVGIDPDQITHIFDRFIQNKQGSDRSEGGLGLGLAIAKSFVEMHGGTISASSSGLGCGSQFSFRVPMVEVPSSKGDPVSADEQTHHPNDTLRILVVDDNQDAAELLAAALDAYGYTTRTAPDGPTALDIVDEFEPSIGLIDIGLPVMDGYELAKRLRAWAGSRPLRLVAVTGYGQESDRRRSAEAGFDAHRVKPVDLKALRQLIAELGETLPASRNTTGL